jgi:hypothetical protein
VKKLPEAPGLTLFDFIKMQPENICLSKQVPQEHFGVKINIL